MELQHPFRAISTSVDGDVLQVLASVFTEMTVPRLSTLIPERSPAGIRLSVDRLAQQGILTVHTMGRTRAYALNDEHLLAPAIRSIASAKRELIDRLRALFADLPTPLAVLFGSAAHGDMHVDSDIDILVVRDGDPDDWDTTLARLAAHVTALTGNDARIVEIAAGDVGAPAYAPLIEDVLSTGITIAGDREVLERGRRVANDAARGQDA